MKTEPKFTEKNKQTVLDYYEKALSTGQCYVNYYYIPHVDAHKHLVKEKILKNVKYRGIFLGVEYKGYLFKIIRGSGDCEEILVNAGKLNCQKYNIDVCKRCKENKNLKDKLHCKNMQITKLHKEIKEFKKLAAFDPLCIKHY
jgi:hypothetical protein